KKKKKKHCNSACFLILLLKQHGITIVCRMSRIENKKTWEEINAHIQMLWYRFISLNARQQVNISHGNYQAIQQFLFPHKHSSLQNEYGQRMDVDANERGAIASSANEAPELKEKTATKPKTNLIISEILSAFPEPMSVDPFASRNNSNSQHIVINPANTEASHYQRRHSDNNYKNSPNSIRYFTDKKDVTLFELYLASASREVSSLINGNLLTRFSESKYYQNYFIEKSSRTKKEEPSLSTDKLEPPTTSPSSLQIWSHHPDRRSSDYPFPTNHNQLVPDQNDDTNTNTADFNKRHRRFSLF
ncbi:hypothetical protein RFI_39450, partial [Reticulomyxa filosa]